MLYCWSFLSAWEWLSCLLPLGDAVEKVYCVWFRYCSSHNFVPIAQFELSLGVGQSDCTTHVAGVYERESAGICLFCKEIMQFLKVLF